MIPRAPAALLAAFVTIVLPSPARAGEPRCERERVKRALPVPAQCLARNDIAALASGARVGALIDAAETDITHSRFQEAERRLDCAEALMLGRGGIDLRHRLLRVRGRLAYARDQLPAALSELTCALELARNGLDEETLASDLNAVGSTLRRLGDYHGALDMLTDSLTRHRRAGRRVSNVLNNIGDVYRDIGDLDEAMRHYREARAGYEADGEAVHAAHVLESMAVIELERGHANLAGPWLEQALATYRDEGRHDYQLRVYGWLMRAALAQGDIDAAQRWSAAGQAVAIEHRLDSPAPFELLAARTDRLSGSPAAAVGRLRGALTRLTGSDVERAGLYEELAAAQEALGDRQGAIDSLRRALVEERAFARAGRNRDLAWLRARFETAERDRTIARLEADRLRREVTLRERTLWLWLTVVLAALCLFGGWRLLRRRRLRERAEEAARLAQKEEELARYRREADALAEDRHLLQALLDSREEAMCLLDADGVVLAANRAAGRLFDDVARALVGAGIAEALPESQRAPLHAALERMEDATEQSLELVVADGRRLRATFGQWPQGDGLIVLGLAAIEAAPRTGEAHEARVRATAHPQAMPIAAMSVGAVHDSAMSVDAARIDAPPGEASSDPIDAGDAGDAGDADALPPATGLDLREDFRRALVELMLSALETWECDTGSGRLELAERSRIWRVAVDDGRVRARSMERYLNLARLPQNPRWRDVVRTAYFVLQQCAMERAARERLQRQVDAVLAYTRRNALV